MTLSWYLDVVCLTNPSIDALPGIGHACGHNLIAIVSLGSALAAANVLREKGLGGQIVLFGTPAEGELSCIELMLIGLPIG